VIEREWEWVELLSLPDGEDDFTDLRVEVVWITWHDSPMIEGALWEGLAVGGLTEISGETERFGNWEGGLDDVHWSSVDGLLGEDHTPLSVKARVDATDSNFWALDFDGEDWFHDAWLGSHHACVHDTTGSWDDLTASSVDGIGVECDIVDVESNTTDIFFAHRTFLGSPLESTNDRVLNFVEVLDTLRGITNNVWTGTFWAESPQLSCLFNVPLVVVGQISASNLWIILGGDLLVVNLNGELFAKRLSLHVEPVVLVWRLREAHSVGPFTDAFTERDDWVGLSEWNTGVIFFKIFEADLKMELTGTGNNVLARFFHVDLDHGVCAKLG
jgi:hypothetical protein